MMHKNPASLPRRTALQLAAALGAASLLGGLAPAFAQDRFPTGAVKIVVPFGPATGPDILGRTIGQKLSEKWGQPLVVENKSGASSMIGTKFVAASAPDGHTLLVTANTLILNKALKPNADYDPINDIVAVAPLAIGRLTLVAHPSLGVKSVQELIAMAKAKPGAIDYASPANGTPHHLAMELFKQGTGVDLTHIPYTSTPAAVKDVLGGQVKLMFLPIHVALPHVQAGKLVMLASGGKQRAETTPDVPSVAEASGVKDFDADIWYGMYAPAGTPPALVNRLNAEVNALLGSPELKAMFERQGLSPLTGTPQDLAKLTRDDLARWNKVVKAAGIKAD
ncbi:tripartite tricarboxylate transporter substrate binding protein [Ramlibacter tataouinensis]|uniref:Bug family tripartite tricarboxylate transporter substrate binding protein n=1 Tax=Ramlibacter tataouinensis TaxID=94132 RepID=UPI0022F3FD60|nr:tripartite tricarboxylate transporter substrate binding protein [Ramlibacter tataouinensis]WBY02895.1 tripartite tricarboxylate transporter substrate binding protein [Ramlibacter tataouinensis]